MWLKRLRQRLCQILQETTIVHQRGEENKGDSEEALVDCHFFTARVKVVKARAYREELVAILKEYWPSKVSGNLIPKLEVGPTSYIQAGAVLGNQEAALLLFALGRVLGFWKVLTPKGTFGITGRPAKLMGRLGFVMISGFQAA